MPGLHQEVTKTRKSCVTSRIQVARQVPIGAGSKRGAADEAETTPAHDAFAPYADFVAFGFANVVAQGARDLVQDH